MLSSLRQMRTFDPKSTIDLSTYGMLQSANKRGGVSLTTSQLREPMPPEESQQARLRMERGIIDLHAGLIRPGAEQALVDELFLAHERRHVTITEDASGLVVGCIDALHSPLTLHDHYPAWAEVLERQRTAIARSHRTVPFAGRVRGARPCLLARIVHSKRHTTPGKCELHFDNFKTSDFAAGSLELARDEGVELGVRGMYTAHCANVTKVSAPRAGIEIMAQAACAGAGLGLTADVRAVSTGGAETIFLHQGCPKMMDRQTPMPQRLQLLLNFSTLDVPAWNAAMDDFRLDDLLAEAEAGRLDLVRDQAAAQLVDSLLAAQLARSMS